MNKCLINQYGDLEMDISQLNSSMLSFMNTINRAIIINIISGIVVMKGKSKLQNIPFIIIIASFILFARKNIQAKQTMQNVKIQ